MKKVFVLFWLMVLVFQLNVAVKAQGRKSPATKTEIYITLAPNEKSQSITISESCLVFLRDFITAIILPMGKQFEWKIPKGTRFEIPAGKYELENKSTSALEIKLLPAEHCPEEK